MQVYRIYLRWQRNFFRLRRVNEKDWRRIDHPKPNEGSYFLEIQRKELFSEFLVNTNHNRLLESPISTWWFCIHLERDPMFSNADAANVEKDRVAFEKQRININRRRSLFTSITNGIRNIDCTERCRCDWHRDVLMRVLIVRYFPSRILLTYWYIDRLSCNVEISPWRNNIRNHYWKDLERLNELDEEKIHGDEREKFIETLPASTIASKPADVRISFRKDSFKLLRERLTYVCSMISLVYNEKYDMKEWAMFVFLTLNRCS